MPLRQCRTPKSFQNDTFFKGVLTSSKRWALYVGFICFSQIVLVSWRIFAGSIWFQILYATSKYSLEHQRHLGEANKKQKYRAHLFDEVSMPLNLNLSFCFFSMNWTTRVLDIVGPAVQKIWVTWMQSWTYLPENLSEWSHRLVPQLCKLKDFWKNTAINLSKWRATREVSG